MVSGNDFLPLACRTRKVHYANTFVEEQEPSRLLVCAVCFQCYQIWFRSPVPQIWRFMTMFWQFLTYSSLSVRKVYIDIQTTNVMKIF